MIIVMIICQDKIQVFIIMHTIHYLKNLNVSDNGSENLAVNLEFDDSRQESGSGIYYNALMTVIMIIQ